MTLLIAGPCAVIIAGAVLAVRSRTRNRNLVLAGSIVGAVLAFVAVVARNPEVLY